MILNQLLKKNRLVRWANLKFKKEEPSLVRRNSPIFMYVIIGIAAIGLFSWLIKEPSRLLITLLVTAVIASIIFLVARTLITGESFSQNRNNDEMRKYRQAVKQSQQKYSKQNVKKSTKPDRFRKQNQKKVRKRPTHLTLIKGRKSMKKNDHDQASN